MKSAGFLNRIRNLSSIFTQLFNTIQKILKVIFQARSQKTKIKWSLDNQSKLQSIENSSEFHKLFQAFEHCSLSQKLVGIPCYVRHSFIFPNEWVCRRVYICRRVSSSNPRFALLSPVCLTYWSKWLLCERLQLGTWRQVPWKLQRGVVPMDNWAPQKEESQGDLLLLLPQKWPYRGFNLLKALLIMKKVQPSSIVPLKSV